MAIINAITETTPEGLEKIKKWLSKDHSNNWELKSKIITLEISSPTDGGEHKVLSIWNSQKP